jgi:hypothetical protein
MSASPIVGSSPTDSLSGDTVPPLLIGTTQKYIFLFDDRRQVTSIVPVSNVARLRVERRRFPSRPLGRADSTRQ